jgi:small neutral amino acid transporter SnatA (MarC family)
MNGILLAVTALAAVNPFRLRGGVPEEPSGRARLVPLVGGAALGFAALAGLAGVSGPFLDAIEVTPETFRIAAGLVAVAAGIRTVVRPEPGEEPELPGWRAALWPVAFPRVVSPEAAAVAITAGSIEGSAAATVVLAAALLVTTVLGVVARTARAASLFRWLAGLTGVLLVAAGVFLMIDGIRSV